MSEAPIIITLPKPPSLNKLWITVGRGRVRSQEYSEWLRVAGWDVRRQMAGVPPIDCRFDVTIQVPISRRDTDNWCKSILDLCEKVGVITNDGNQHRLSVEPMERDDCAVFLTPLPEMGGVRKAPSAKFRSSALRRTRPKQQTIMAFERIRAGILR